MTSTDWAAWVQAIGSIAGIFAAIWLGKRQYKQLSDAANERQIAQSILIKKWVSIVNDLYDEAHKAGESQNLGKYKKVGSQLYEMLNWSNTFSLDTQESDVIEAYVNIRKETLNLSEILINATGMHGNNGSRAVKEHYIEFRNELKIFDVPIFDWGNN